MLLGMTIYFLLADQQSFAEISSIYLYYCLVVGVFFELIEGRIAHALESDFLLSFPRIKSWRETLAQNERIQI